MEIQEIIRQLREKNDWSQEDMAERVGLSKNGYAKIERGETNLNLERLEQIANLFDLSVIDLIEMSDKSVVCMITDSINNSNNHYNGSETMAFENEKLKLIISHKDEIIHQKEREITALNKLIDTLNNQK
jgi:transcriptional regulator with XRE-family HTH domain